MATATQDLEQTRAGWDSIATGYDALVTPTHWWIAEEGLRRAGLRRGMRVLDVAAGSGGLSIPAARMGARVLATDLAPEMLRGLEARARREGLAEVEVRAMDGHALELDDDTFDMAGSQFGVMLFPDMPLGVREMARVTRPGGRVLVHAYGDPREVEFLSFFLDAAHAAVPGFQGPPLDPPPLPFQLRDPERLREVLSDAGLTEIRVETVPETLEFESATAMLDWLATSNPIGAMLVGGFDEAQRVDVRDALERSLRERAAGDGPAVLTNPVHIGFGTK
ncbi:MAG: class I SAM-dependent methyltransferase [Gemmatimonadetes bacterium]|nr:class I SAM-dependent methyltransferase [Gemmatimonadota bacterium]